MAFDIKKREVDRLYGLLVVLGWEILKEEYGDKDITLTIHLTLSDQLLAAAGLMSTPKKTT